MVTGCDASTLGQSAQLAPSGDRTQIHPDVVWDGEAFWVTWNIANDEGKFETWAGRFACDLSALVAPFAVEQTAGMNDVDPSISVRGDTVLIAWARDDGGTSGARYNLTTRVAAYHRVSGEVITVPTQLQIHIDDTVTTAEEALERSNEGEASSGNLWMVSLGALPEGGFLIAGSWGDPERNTFRVYVQHLDELGSPVGSAWLVDPEGANQGHPVVSVSAYGVIDVLWQGDDAQGQSGLFSRSWRRDIVSPLRGYIEEGWVGVHTMRNPHLPYAEGLIAQAPQGQDLGLPWAVGNDAEGSLRFISPTGQEQGVAPRRPLRLMRFIPQGIVGYQQRSGTEHDVLWRVLNRDATWGDFTFITGELPAAPYPLAAAHFEGGAILIWAEGYNPNFTLRASLISAPGEP